MNLTTRQKMLITIALIIVSVIAIAVLLIVPQFTKLSTLQEQKTKTQAKIELDQSTLTQLNELKNSAAAGRAESLQLATKMPDVPQLPTLMVELQNIANKSGITIVSFAPTQPVIEAPGQYSRILMSLQISARWDDLLDYLRRLNDAPRLLRVTNIVVSPSSKDATENKNENAPLSVTLTLNAYCLDTTVANGGSVAATSSVTTTSGAQ